MADVDQEPVTEEEDSGGALAMALLNAGLFEDPEEASDAQAEEAAETDAPADASEPAPADAPADSGAVDESDADAGEAPAAEAAEADTSDVSDDADEEAVDDAEAEDAPPPKPAVKPYDLPGDWYVIHSYSGYENKVKANLETRISTMHMDSSVFDVVIPMEDVVEIKGGKKVTVPKKVLPGYLLVRMYMDDDAWFTVRNTPGVTGFVGSGTKPSPLTKREVERFLGTPEEEGEETKAAPRFKPAWDVGESVRVVDGPFADFNGVIEDINLDQSKVRVLVNIFDRETPVELTFEQIVKI